MVQPEGTPPPEAAAEAEDLPRDRMAELLSEGLYDQALAYAHQLHPAQLADVLEALSDEDRRTVLLGLDGETLAEALYYVESHFRGQLLLDLAPAGIGQAISEVPDDIATDIVQDLDDEVAEQVLSGIPPARRRAIERLLAHGEDTAGGRMTGQVVTVRPSFSVGQTIEALRSARPDISQPFYIYVTDARRRLLGVLNLRALIASPPETPVTDVMETDLLTVAVDADQEEAARLLRQYRLLAIPVVDSLGHLLGTVTSDDLLDVIEEEATEDMFRIVGVSEEEDLRNVGRSIRYRLPWLSVNLVTALAAGYVVSLFESTLQQAVALAAFLPVIAGHGGNAGIQTLTVVVRSLALGRIRLEDAMPLVTRQLVTGLVMGMVTSVALALVALAWRGDPWLGFVVGTALVANVLIGVFFGTVIPLGLQRLGQDPALSGGIWLTTATDVLGFFVYLSIATVFISRLG